MDSQSIKDIILAEDRPISYKINSSPVKKPAETTKQSNISSVPTNAADVDKNSYAGLFMALNPEKPLSPEAEEILKKRQRNRQIISAVGDGIAALSNLFGTFHGAPNAYTGKNTLSEASRVRYDKMMKDFNDKRDRYNAGLYNAYMLDKKAAADAKAAADKAERENRKSQFEYMKWLTELQDKRDEQEYRRKRDEKEDELEEKRLKNYSDRTELQRTNKTSKRRGDGTDTYIYRSGDYEVEIADNVWESSWQQVFDILKEEKIGDWRSAKTSKNKEDFVKQNWHKSERARDLMVKLSNRSGIENEDIIDYVPYDLSEDPVAANLNADYNAMADGMNILSQRR